MEEKSRNRLLLGSKVKGLAHEKGMPLYKIEESSDIARGSISKWDEVSPSFDKVVSVANVLGVSITYFIE